MDLEIAELEKKVQKQQENDREQQAKDSITGLVHEEIQDQYEESKKALIKSEKFKNLADEITRRSAEAELGKDMLAILSQEQKNALAQYVLECEKKKLDFKQKKEKGLIEEDVKAQVFAKKVEILKNRYGHLYEKDENGNIKNFVPSKSYNKYKSFVNWWDNTSDGFKKITKGVLRFLLWGGIIALVIIIGKAGFEWLINFSRNLPQA